MDPTRFDALARAFTANGALPRRGVFGLAAALALPGVVTGRRKKKPKKTCKPACAPCEKCVKGTCKPDAARDGDACGAGTCKAGACVTCAAGQWGGAICPQGQCCPDGQVCLSEGGCGTCPPRPDFCASTVLRGCGSTGDAAEPDCACVTSRQGTTTCSSLYGACYPCTTDAQCTAVAGGVPAVCVSAAECGGCQNGNTLCMVAGCVAPPSTASRAVGLSWSRVAANRLRS